MAEYIERGRLKEAISADCQHLFSFDTSFYDMVMIDIDEVPAEDVAPVVHGKWEHPHWHNSTHCMNCSVCKQEAQHGEFRGVEKFYPICPNCGAKMDLED